MGKDELSLLFLLEKYVTLHLITNLCVEIMQNRIKNHRIQILRAFAIIAVVMIHTSPPAAGQVIFRPFINFGVATFLFLSGYLTKIDNND